MTTRITSAQALELAHDALDGGLTEASTRAIARWVEAVLGEDLTAEYFYLTPTLEPKPTLGTRWINCAIGCVKPALARAYAAALLRAADEAEADKP